MLVVNFKTYESATGLKAIELAKLHEKIALETGVKIAIAVQAVDIFAIVQAVKIPVFAQHIDIASFGSFTGSVTSEAIKSAGAVGTLLNHSEHRLDFEILKNSIARAQEVGLQTIVCAATAEEGGKIAEFNPDFIAVEPPELIGGDISVSTAQPEIISDAAKLVGANKLLVGAGIKNSSDIRVALQRGAVGVLLASGVTKAKDPEAVLRDLAKGFK